MKQLLRLEADILKSRRDTMETSSSSLFDDDETPSTMNTSFDVDDIHHVNPPPLNFTRSSSSNSTGEASFIKNIDTHYIFLSHGWLGCPQEMGYMKQAIQTQVEESSKPHSSTGGTWCADKCRVVVHSVTCNHKRTHDGIENGGSRLANEIQTFIKQDQLQVLKSFSPSPSDNENKRSDERHVSLSLVGNSLGGLYARFALSCLPTEFTITNVNTTSQNDVLIDDKYTNNNATRLDIKIHYNIFISTATPHLGCASHTYLNLPRLIETIFGRICSKTGRDLFCIHKKKRESTTKSLSTSHRRSTDNDKHVIFEMGTNYNRFLQPLSQFRKRIAYINAFQTDFQVPTSTAAFLSDDSTYPHHSISAKYDDSQNTISRSKVSTSQSTSDTEESFVVATVQTEINDVMLQSHVSFHETKRVQDLIMSNKLDALGWDKVFIDSREMNPIPSVSRRYSCGKYSPKQFQHKNIGKTGWEQYCQDRLNDYHVNDADDTFRDNSSASDETPCNSTRSNISFGSSSGSKTSPYRSLSSLSLNSSKSMQSKDVKLFMTSKSEKIQIPVGHNMLIANNKSRGAEKFYSKGQPIVDMLAKNLMKDLTCSST